MNSLEAKINVELKKVCNHGLLKVGIAFCLQAAKELELEMHKAIKLEFTSQLGYFFRITKKVCQAAQ